MIVGLSLGATVELSTAGEAVSPLSTGVELLAHPLISIIVIVTMAVKFVSLFMFVPPFKGVTTAL